MALRVIDEYFTDIPFGTFKRALVEVYRTVGGDREDTSADEDDSILDLFPPLPTAYLPDDTQGCNYRRLVTYRTIIYTVEPDIIWYLPLPFKSGQQQYIDVLSVILNNDFSVIIQGERRAGEVLRLI